VLAELLAKIGKEISAQASTYASLEDARIIRTRHIRLAFLKLTTGSVLSGKVLPELEARVLNKNDDMERQVKRKAHSAKVSAALAALNRATKTPELLDTSA
jgi:hypothetical protein